MDRNNLAARAISSLKEMIGAPREQENRGTACGDAEDKLAALREELAAERSARLAAEGRLTELQVGLEQQRREENLSAFAAALLQAEEQKRITPAERKGLVSLGSRLDEKGRQAILEEVSLREPLALFEELSAPEADAAGREDFSRRRALFEGFPEDPEHDKALELMAAEPELSFAEAIRRVRSVR
jgi:hypothetical protein